MVVIIKNPLIGKLSGQRIGQKITLNGSCSANKIACGGELKKVRIKKYDRS